MNIYTFTVKAMEFKIDMKSKEKALENTFNEMVKYNKRKELNKILMCFDRAKYIINKT